VRKVRPSTPSTEHIGVGNPNRGLRAGQRGRCPSHRYQGPRCRAGGRVAACPRALRPRSRPRVRVRPARRARLWHACTPIVSQMRYEPLMSPAGPVTDGPASETETGSCWFRCSSPRASSSSAPLPAARARSGCACSWRSSCPPPSSSLPRRPRFPRPALAREGVRPGGSRGPASRGPDAPGRERARARRPELVG